MPYERIEINPEIMRGKPVIKGTRITVETILRKLGAGMSAKERERLKTLERENRELRKANEILKAASVFFAKELDPTRPK